jgi:hypothetical protein
MRVLVGNMQFPALLLYPSSLLAATTKTAGGYANEKALEAGGEEGKGGRAKSMRQQQPLKLWGLTLGMTLDLLAHMAPTPLTPWDADALMGITGVEAEPELPYDETHYQDGKRMGNGDGMGVRRRSSSLVVAANADERSHASEGSVGEKGRKGRKLGRGKLGAPPSLTSVFPRFSYPDVNFWIW